MKNILLTILVTCLLFACKNTGNSDAPQEEAAPQNKGEVEVDVIAVYNGAKDASTYDLFPQKDGVKETFFHYFMKNPDSLSGAQMIIMGESLKPDVEMQAGAKVKLKGKGILRENSPTYQSIILKEVQSIEPEVIEVVE